MRKLPPGAVPNPGALTSAMDRLSSLWNGDPHEGLLLRRNALHLMKVKHVVVARVLKEEGVDLSEARRVHHFLEEDEKAINRLYMLLSVALNATNGPRKLDPESATRLMDSLNRNIHAVAVPVVRDYQQKVLEAEVMANTLEDQWRPVESKPPAAAPDEEEECIICLEEQRSTVYKPCRHRVCCQACAEAYWQQSRSCPWCDREVEEV